MLDFQTYCYLNLSCGALGDTYFLGGVETGMGQARSDSTDGDASCARLDPVRWIIVTNVSAYLQSMDCQREPQPKHREPLFATPCCNTSRATWSSPSEPHHMKPLFEVLWFAALVQAAVVNFFVLNLVCFISVCPCIPETGRLENMCSCCGFWLWSWLAAFVNLFVLNLLCFISVCLYPKRTDCRTRTYREKQN